MKSVLLHLKVLTQILLYSGDVSPYFDCNSFLAKEIKSRK